LVQYVIAMATVEYESETTGGSGGGAAIAAEMEALMEENERLKKAFDKVSQEKTELQRNFNKTLKGAIKDSNAEMQKEKQWRSTLEGKFADLLKDYRAVLKVAKVQRTTMDANTKTVGTQKLAPVTKTSTCVRVARKLH